MYLNHFGLDEPPFRITPHTDFFFAGANRGATLEALLYAITHDEGIIKVSGEVGSGKTMLCRVLMERVPGHVDTILLSNPSLARDEILYAIADELEIDSSAQRQPLLLRALQDHLIRLYSQGRRVVVLIDEAHAMPQETLEQIRLLSNLETSHAKLMQIVLFGQPELDAHLSMPQMRPLKERITHSFRLEPLARSDIEAYLDFRMRAAGYRGPKVFAPEAVRRIVKASEGLTRRVNILADKSLLAAFADDEHGITARHVDRAIRDSEFHRPAASRSRIGLAAGGVAAGLALGLGLHYLLSPSTPPSSAPASTQASANGALQAQPAPAPPASMTATARAAAASVDVLATPAAAPPRERPPAPAAGSAGADSRNYLPPPPAGALTRARFDATQEWLKGAPGDHYSIQLYTADAQHLRAVEGLLARAAPEHLDLTDFHLYGVKIDGRQHYRLAYGLYATPAQADQHIKSLPMVYRQSGPYLRSVERMRSQNRQ
ncbi:MAG: AAA family ATPase [Burkholderiales bacterium]|nr:AAA family ATPase [Burkholderiales bacterium]